MTIETFSALLAPKESLGMRLGVMAGAFVFGAWMIYVGRHNVQTRTAEESGKRALGLALLGKSASLTGRMAVATGWMRILVGVAAIVFGIVFLFFGAFLKK
ncbi:MAG TPA: hypothetical protein VM509_07475 [Planctomycetota bacterium]|nr:hypothetical protein [Planctomycetota bacterium]